MSNLTARIEAKRGMLALPIGLCLLALLGMPRLLLVWLDGKALDLLFVTLPFAAPEHPVVVLAKDPLWLDTLGHEPDRADMAQLIDAVAAAGSPVAALDFIYEQPQSPATDARLAEALSRLPGAVAAERFQGRSQLSGLRALDLVDERASRPLPPKPLVEPIEGAVAEHGLINVYLDHDGVARFLPLAFLPEGQTEYRPTLGFAAWLQALLAAARPPAAPAAGTPPEAWFTAALAQAPYPFRSLGHPGLDQIARRRELLWLARRAGLPVEAAWAMTKLESLPARSYLDLPSEPIPWMGPATAPCLRIPFSRQSWPRKGDGIPVVSMGALWQTRQGSLRSTLEVASTRAAEPMDLRFRLEPPGACSLQGRALDFGGHPLAGVEVLCQRQGGGYWDRTTSSADGSFRCSKLPDAAYSVELSRRQGMGLQRLVLAEAAACSADARELPPARFLPMTASLAGSLEPRPWRRRLELLSDGVWLAAASSDAAKLPAPPGFSRVELEDGTLAIVEDQPTWKPECSAGLTLEPNAAGFTLRDLCPAKGARFSAERAAPEPVWSPPAEADLLVDAATSVSGAVPETASDWSLASPGFRLPDGVAAWLISSRGEWTQVQADAALRAGRYQALATRGELRGGLDRLASLLGGRTVFLGTRLVEDFDFQITPINFLDREFKNLPGVHLHANLYSALARGDFLWPTPLHYDANPVAWPLWHLLILLPGLACVEEGFRRRGALAGGALTLLAAGLWLIAAALLFRRHVLLPCSLALICFAAYGVARGSLAYAVTRRREQEARTTFGRFVSAQMVERILKNPDALKPGGERKRLTVLFTDLAGFTSLAETMEPEQLTSLMNEYLAEMTDVLFAHDGTLDKYIGDAIMGFWNHPTPQPDHELRAVRCALAMQERLEGLRRAWRERGLPDISMRAGIHTADCIVGFIGSSTQMNFTCLGDGVNLASRLEGANKAYGTLMMISEATHSALGGAGIRTRMLDWLAVKGKARPIRVYELLQAEAETSKRLEAILPLYEAGLRDYLARDFEAARARFEEILALHPDDGPARTYKKRCAAFLLEPPPEDWDGRFQLSSK